MASLPYSLEALYFGTSNSIGGIIPDVVFRESHSDEITITQHPVDYGANVNDHAFEKNSIITCQFGWSDSSRLLNSAIDGSIFKGLVTAKDVYNKLLELQRSRIPFTLKTTKRDYGNVLIQKLETTTDDNTLNIYLIDVTFEQIMIANTETVYLSPATQANPSKTASMTKGGLKHPVSVIR